MSERAHMSAAEEVAAGGKRIAIQMEARHLADQAARLKKLATRPPPTCKFCREEHRTTECTNGTPEERKEKAVTARLCLLCLGPANHPPAKCRILRFAENLCQRRRCNDFPQYSLHHKNICAGPIRRPPTPQEEEEEDDLQILRSLIFLP